MSNVPVQHSHSPRIPRPLPSFSHSFMRYTSHMLSRQFTRLTVVLRPRSLPCSLSTTGIRRNRANIDISGRAHRSLSSSSAPAPGPAACPSKQSSSNGSTGRRRFMRDGYIATFIGITIGATAFGFNIETRNSDAEARGRFRKFKIVDILQLGGYTRLFKLSSQAAPILPPVPPGSGGSNQPLIWSIEVKQPFLQIARRYSPLPIIQPGHDTHQDDDQALQLYVSGQHAGEMSRYIFSLPPGRISRGPWAVRRIPHRGGATRVGSDSWRHRHCPFAASCHCCSDHIREPGSYSLGKSVLRCLQRSPRRSVNQLAFPDQSARLSPTILFECSV